MSTTRTPSEPRPRSGPSTEEVVSTFLEFFRERGHHVLRGGTLVPPPGGTVLFTTSGMHPLTPFLLGDPHPDGRRLTDVQRCLRTTDLDEVGDRTHLTVFEMLGSWSLGGPEVGGYDGRDSLRWGVELLGELGVGRDRLHGTVFGGFGTGGGVEPDTGSLEVLTGLGVRTEVLGGENWWSNGPTGPCGPDCELFAWTGEGEPVGTPSTDERWVEVWNHVMMRHERRDDGTLGDLDQPNVDTGMGLERVVMVLQGVGSVFETDGLLPWSTHLERLWGLGTTGTRVLSDHLRSGLVVVGDGVRPSTSGRGHVLRRLVRRGLSRLWEGDRSRSGTLNELSGELVELTRERFGLETPGDVLVGVLVEEETRFRRLLERGRPVVERRLRRGPLDGDDLRDLHETHGLPGDVVEQVVRELEG